jgi:hypothetical protein
MTTSPEPADRGVPGVRSGAHGIGDR